MMNRRLIDLSNGAYPPQGFLSSPKPSPSVSNPSPNIPTSINLHNIPNIIRRNIVPEDTMIQPQQPPAHHPRSITTIQSPMSPTVMPSPTPDQAKNADNVDTKVTNDIHHPRNKFSTVYEDMMKNGKLKIYYA